MAQVTCLFLFPCIIEPLPPSEEDAAFNSKDNDILS